VPPGKSVHGCRIPIKAYVFALEQLGDGK